MCNASTPTVCENTYFFNDSLPFEKHLQINYIALFYI